MRPILLVLIILFILSVLLVSNLPKLKDNFSLNPAEQRVAKEHDGTEAFYEQVKISSGCVNLRIDDAKQVYNWAGPAMPSGAGVIRASADNPGVRVLVHD